MTYNHFEYVIDDHIARITINRPKSYNALNLESMKELCDIVNRCGSDRSVRAVLITGSGAKAFCAGGTCRRPLLKIRRLSISCSRKSPGFSTWPSRAWPGWRYRSLPQSMAWRQARGTGLATCCDLAIAADNAVFTSAYTQIGLTPDGSATYYLPRLIGRRRAMRLFLTNRVLNAQEALDWGLVNRVVPQALAVEAEKLARQLASGPTQAYGGVKKLMQLSANDTLESQMERETRQIAALSRTPDGR